MGASVVRVQAQPDSLCRFRSADESSAGATFTDSRCNSTATLGVDNEVADGQDLVVEVEVIDSPDVSISHDDANFSRYCKLSNMRQELSVTEQIVVIGLG